MLTGKWAVSNPTKYKKFGPMGLGHIQTSSGNLVYNVPYANTAYPPKRMPGSIIREEGGKRVIADVLALDDTDTAYKDDPHNVDKTGSAIVQGNFFANDKESEHFAIGAPKANKLTGRVYVCYKCFYPKAERKDGDKGNPSFQVELESSQKQTGERFGAAVAAVDVDGDGIDELVIGAPLYSSKVSIEIIIRSKSLTLFYNFDFHRS